MPEDIDLSLVGNPNPDPVNPDPVNPDPVNPDPVNPDPVNPDPVNPDPVNPDPVNPDPVNPDPVQPDENTVLDYLKSKLGLEKLSSLDELKPKELNPQLVAIQEWAEKTGRPIEDWTKYNKDYSKMSDVDKAREILELKYPTLTKDEIDLELEQYIANEDDYESDAKRKSLALKKLVTEGSEVLEANRLQFGEPVPGYSQLTPELKVKLDFAEAAKASYDQTQKDIQDYKLAIDTTVSKTEKISLKLGEDMVIDYNLSPVDKKELPDFIHTIPHWYNPDGSFNHAAVVEDSLKIKNFDTLIKMAYEQGLNKGKEDKIAELNNIDLGSRTVDLPNSGEGIQIEGRWKQNRPKFKRFGK